MPDEMGLKKLENELKKEAEARDKLPDEEAPVQAAETPEPLEADETEMMEPEPPPAMEPKVAEEEPAPPEAKTPLFSSLGSKAGFMGLSIGYFDAHSGGNKAVSFGAEWKPGIRIARILQPMIGGLVTTDGSYFGYAGLGLPVKLGKKLMLTPSVALGGLGGGNDNLGQTLTYRFGGELEYLLKNGSRVGLTGQMITNGSSFGKDDRIDVIALTYTIPLGPVDTGMDSDNGM